jgi:ppGpp synthetase/RelA/SpoT-type nucleotidyltranferase
MSVINTLQSFLKEFEICIKNIQNEYNFDLSFSKNVEKYDLNTVYQENIVKYFEYVTLSESINSCLDDLSKFINEDFQFSYRYKTYESIKNKWNKYKKCKRPLKKVLNDLIGFRIILRISRDSLNEVINDYYSNNNIKIVNFYKKQEDVDNGYRGLHLYYRLNGKNFTNELQIWTIEDSILNFYTHELIYKKGFGEESKTYAVELRKWLDCESLEIKRFIEFIYFYKSERKLNNFQELYFIYKENFSFDENELKKWLIRIPNKAKNVEMDFPTFWCEKMFFDGEE